MSYRIELIRIAVKQLTQLPPRIQIKIKNQINKLQHDPRPDGVKKLSGEDGIYRIKVAKDYRVVYQIKDDQLIVLIIKIGYRKDAYR
jgi:mRNA interferase RelE/StbE